MANNPPHQHVFVVTFDQTPQTRFYMCRSCRSHLLARRDQLFRDRGLDAIICRQPVNVKVEPVESRWIFHHHPVVDVSCRDCNANLGQKFVRIAEPNAVVQEGRFLLYLDKMVFWNGDDVVYADTSEKVEDN